MTPDEALRKLLMGYERRIKALEEDVTALRRERSDPVVERSLETPRFPAVGPRSGLQRKPKDAS